MNCFSKVLWLILAMGILTALNFPAQAIDPAEQRERGGTSYQWTNCKVLTVAVNGAFVQVLDHNKAFCYVTPTTSIVIPSHPGVTKATLHKYLVPGSRVTVLGTNIAGKNYATSIVKH